MLPLIQIHTGLVRNPTRIGMPDGTPALFAAFEPDGGAAEPLTICSDKIDQAGIADVFRDGSRVTFLGRPGPRNLAVLGLAVPLVNPHLVRLGCILAALQNGQTIILREPNPGSFSTEIWLSLGYGTDPLPRLRRRISVVPFDGLDLVTQPEETEWTLTDLIRTSGCWPSKIVDGLPELDYTRPSPALAALMVLEQAGQVTIPPYHPTDTVLPVVLTYGSGIPDQIAVAGHWQTAGLDALIVYGLDRERVPGRAEPKAA